MPVTTAATVASLLTELGQVLHDTRTREGAKLPWTMIERQLASDGQPPMGEHAARRTCWRAEKGEHVRDVDRLVRAYARAADTGVADLLGDAVQGWLSANPDLRAAVLSQLDQDAWE